jgi:hypothetical protein
VPAPCSQRNPLTRLGLTQDGRRRAELARDHFLPDERDLSDLILFGQRFARHIRYYDPANKADGNWAAFFESDLTASLAALAELPVDAFRTFHADLEKWLRAKPGRNPVELAAHAKLLFHLPVALLEEAAAHHARLPSDHPFASALVALVGRDLAEPLAGLIGWYKGASSAALAANAIFQDSALVAADYNIAGAPGDPRVRLSSTIAAAIKGRPALSAAALPAPILAALPGGGWAGFYAATSEDISPYVDAIGAPNSRYEQIYDALTYNLLAAAVKRFYQAAERIRRDAAGHLAASLESFAGHDAHYGLWLAFLQLFDHARGELNAFTGRHLDHYFGEILGLSPRAPVPDQVHLLFELAKGRAAHRLAAGTLFRGGKDARGNPVSYALESEIVVNRGRVAELRALRIETGGTTARTEIPRAAPVVRSRDGIGKVEPAKENAAWPPFGPAASPAARIGFAIADRKLFLREGRRTISIRAELAAPIPSTAITPFWVARLTGDEGWFEISGTAQIETRLDNRFAEPGAGVGAGGGKGGAPPGKPFARDQDDLRQSGRFRRPPPKGSRLLHIVEITLSLDADAPPIVPLDAKLHGGDHAPGLPTVEIAFDFERDATARSFAVLRDVVAERVTLRTTASGLKQLMIVAGGAEADPVKPFAPFGAQPRAGASLIVGSSEIFSKPIAAWRLDVDWEQAYDDDSFFWKNTAGFYDPNVELLSGGQWAGATGVAMGLGAATTTIALGAIDPDAGLVDQSAENSPLHAGATGGFARLRLPHDFGHAAFVGENTRALIGMAGGAAYSPGFVDRAVGRGRGRTSRMVTSVNTYAPDPSKPAVKAPRAPYDPMITRIEASYESPREPVAAFSHLHPFGVSAGGDGRLFPDLPFEGALLVGVADFEPPARLTLLAQVADGSGDPLKKAPKLDFAFLAGDQWVPFEPQDVDDRTANLTGSAILGLNLPELADTNHRLLPSGLHWISIAVSRDADALNKLLSIDAQAARATFADAGNDPDFLATPLPAGTIAKLVVPDLAIKKVVQPYSSFGGRPREAADQFAIRVSERLRHKDRAVTMFDYEAMVLEAFPRLYRVKCLSTTELVRDPANLILGDNELKPGAVTLVTVPWLRGHNARDPLRPYADQATLTAVDAFLRKRISPFVRLEVQNPRFEEIQVDFKVRFHPEIGDIAFYMDELNKAVIGFLTPWMQSDGGEISFGGKMWKSSIIDFVEEQPQVDFVTEFKLYHKPDIAAPAGGWTPIDVEIVEATTARSILVSAARHIIGEVPANA